jgi:LysR family transcriptional activator of nhaA
VIAKEGGIAAAAKELRIGQPTLSSQLKQLESLLGTALFERHHRRLSLTETGRVVQEYARHIFQIGTEMVEVLHDRLPSKRLRVFVGALDSVPKHVTLELTRAAFAVSSCSMSILEGKADELLTELQAHRIDLLVSNFVPPATEASGVFSRRIARSPIVVCGAAGFRRARKDFPSSLQDLPFVMPTSHSKVRQDIDHYLRLSGLQVDVVAEAQDTAIQKLMGLDGMGLIPVPLVAVREYLEKGSLFEVGRLEGVYEDLYLVSASRKIANPVSSALMKSFVMPEPDSKPPRQTRSRKKK